MSSSEFPWHDAERATLGEYSVEQRKVILLVEIARQLKRIADSVALTHPQRWMA